MAQPNHPQEWVNIARERLSDAQRLHSERENSVGSVYLAGYAVECIIKAYLRREGIRFPSRGREGHNIRDLWGATGFHIKEINDRIGNKTFYIQYWSTALRYETSTNAGINNEDLITGAGYLLSFFSKVTKRSKGKRK